LLQPGRHGPAAFFGAGARVTQTVANCFARRKLLRRFLPDGYNRISAGAISQMTSGTPNGMAKDWVRPMVDPQSFRNEQEWLGHIWTFLGFTWDAANHGDWFRAALGARSVFVQRFGDQLKGFENRCAHRFYPLRNADKGNGPIVCDFHHWRYDQDGRALGIPLCEDLFGTTPRELGARLRPVEIATCGALIFGRFKGPGPNESLQKFLADGFPILEAISATNARPKPITQTIKANWRLCFHVTLEDYHIVAVHPSTFGKDGHIRRDDISYYRFGTHSAYFTTKNENALAEMADACRNGTWRSADYRVFQIFPNLVVTHVQADPGYWYIVVLQYSPLASDRSLMRAWIYPAPFPATRPWHHPWTYPFTAPFRGWFVRYYANRIFAEDNLVCERQQSIAHQIDEAPILGALEERMAWFEATYAQAMDASRAPGCDKPITG